MVLDALFAGGGGVIASYFINSYRYGGGILSTPLTATVDVIAGAGAAVKEKIKGEDDKASRKGASTVRKAVKFGTLNLPFIDPLVDILLEDKLLSGDTSTPYRRKEESRLGQDNWLERWYNDL